jgi:hypothetical protein
MTQELHIKHADPTLKNASSTPPETRSDAVREGFKSHTEGEKKFNNLTYKWVGYFGVTAFSVFLTWLIKDTKPLSGYFQKGVTKLTETFTSIHKNDAVKRKGFFNSVLTIGTLFTGGSIVSVLPIKWLEDNKLRLVKKFDREIYGDEAVATDPKIMAAHQLIAAQPKQSWASVVGSRVTAFIATYGTLLVIGANDGMLAKKLGTSIDTLGVNFGRFMDRIRSSGNPKRIQKIGTAITENIADPNLNKELRTLTAHDSIFSKVFSYIGMDAIYTLITSVGLFVSTRFLGPLFYKNEKTANAAVNKPQQPISPLPKASGQDRAGNLKVDPQGPALNISNIHYEDRLASPDKKKNLESITPT